MSTPAEVTLQILRDHGRDFPAIHGSRQDRCSGRTCNWEGDDHRQHLTDLLTAEHTHDLLAAADLLSAARCDLLDPDLRRRWGRRRKALLDRALDAGWRGGA